MITTEKMLSITEPPQLVSEALDAAADGAKARADAGRAVEPETSTAATEVDPVEDEPLQTELLDAVAQVAPIPGATAASVEELARLVTGRMRDAEEALLRHFESLEVEATRRCELLVTQAELDAELIRVTARRQAHDIVAAARAQTTGAATADPDGRLGELSGPLARFIDDVDGLVPPSPRAGE